MQSLGDGALRFARQKGLDSRELLENLRRCPGVRDAVVTEDHACVYFDPTDPPSTDAIEELATRIHAAPHPEPRLVAVRARYDGADVSELAAHAGLSCEDVVALHAGGEYRVAMIGFLPGFAYLSGLDPRLAMPRRAPRTRVPARAIGVAASYTGIYPFASSGGWNLIATALDFTAFTKERGATLAIGDRVRFVRTD